MTPDILGYYRGEVRGLVAYAELSKGRGLTGKGLWGVTIRAANGGDELVSLSRCCFSHAEAMQYLRSTFHPEGDN